MINSSEKRVAKYCIISEKLISVFNVCLFNFKTIDEQQKQPQCCIWHMIKAEKKNECITHKYIERRRKCIGIIRFWLCFWVGSTCFQHHRNFIWIIAINFHKMVDQLIFSFVFGVCVCCTRKKYNLICCIWVDRRRRWQRWTNIKADSSECVCVYGRIMEKG